MSKLVLAWQDPADRMWVPVGILEEEKETFKFYFLNGVRKVSQNGHFSPLHAMGQLDEVYTSDTLFPLFKNRLLPKSRPEYRDYLNWLNLNENASQVQELALTNGLKLTDSFQLYALPEEKNGKYEMHFFAHGIQYLSRCAQERILQLKPDETLFVMKDFQNVHDTHALCLRANSPTEIIGYVPKIYAEELAPHLTVPDSVNVSVTKVNPDAPSQLQLLCKLETHNLSGYAPFTADNYQPYCKD